MDIEYQNADLWGLWGGANAPRAPPLVTGLARCWNTTLDEYLKSFGYYKSKADKCIYVKSVKEANRHISFVILGVHVCDIIPVSNDPAMLKAEKAALCERFEMTDKGEIHYRLGLSIKRERESQEQ